MLSSMSELPAYSYFLFHISPHIPPASRLKQFLLRHILEKDKEFLSTIGQIRCQIISLVVR
jgi:hypothetical protein